MGPRFGGAFWSDNVLRCPSCDSGCLHHTRVEVFVREGEDSPHGLHVIVRDVNGFEIRDDVEEGNPSPRRDGVLIHLWCENCRVISVLTLSQHKGSTLVDIEAVAFEKWMGEQIARSKTDLRAERQAKLEGLLAEIDALFEETPTVIQEPNTKNTKLHIVPTKRVDASE